MTTKSFSRKQIIVPMSSANIERFITMLNKHIANINRLLKDIKSDIVADFIWIYNRGLVITTNKVVVILDLNTIKKYIKNIDMVNMNEVMSPRLPQSKSYLKILDIPYYIENTNLTITPDIVATVLQTTHIFIDVVLTSYSWVIKASPKSDMVVIWVDI